MTTEKYVLLGRDCSENTIKYLGDGVYAGFDGHQIWLVCRREEGYNFIALEPRTFDSLTHFGQDYHFIKLQEDSSEPGEHKVVLDAIKEC